MKSVPSKAFLHGETNELHPVAATSGPEQKGLPPLGECADTDGHHFENRRLEFLEHLDITDL